MKIIKFLLLICIVVCVGGCASMINIHNAQKYDIAAFNAIEIGDWKTARMNYGRALYNAELGGADVRSIARLNYEYGRASGVICDWAEAERAINKAYQLDKKSKGPYWMPLVELQRMSIAQKDYEKAIKYLEMLMPILKEINADTMDPLGYADILDEYVLVLEKNEQEEEVQTWKERAAQLRATFPEGESHTDITPYGKYCQ